MRIIVLGGDGYLGWPTAMHLSASGHEIVVVDNYLRRNIVREENVSPLFETPNLNQRVSFWKDKTGLTIKAFICDLNDWSDISEIFHEFRPEGIVHFAEQPSAPYSMKNRKTSILTIKNNINVTANVIFAVKKYCPDAHIVKLGTMGEYGTPNIDIEEGWLDVEHNDRRHKFLYPRQAGSLYHTTKIMDTDLLWFYVRMWGLRVTDLMQGPVYGLFTNETKNDLELLPFFNYDELFGTVLNRFVVQAVAGYPLTVYGKGGQTRGYINIIDSINCVRLSLENPAHNGQLRIFNQFTETFSVNELAKMVCDVGKQLGLDVKMKHMENPRIELEEHYYNPKHTGLVNLGLKPNVLNNETLLKIMEFVKNYSGNIRTNTIFRGVKW